MQKYNNRNEVPEEFKWDLTSFFKSEKEFNDTYEKTTKLAKELKKYNGCTKDANKVYEFLCKETEVTALWEDLYVYSYLINDQELGNPSSMARKKKAEQLNTLICTNISFFAPELLKLSKEEYNQLYDKCPKLKEYKADLDKIYREKEHVLSEKEEIIINELTDAMNNYDDISSNLLNSQHDYGKVKVDDEIVTIANNNYRALMRNKDEQVRKKVYTSFNKKIEQYSETNASLLNGYVSMNETIAKLRNHKDSWEMKLFSLNLNDKVFKTLLETTEENLSSLQKYYRLKSKVLGIDKLRTYDILMELVKNNKEYSIPEAQELIRKALKPLGKEYLEKYDKIIKNRYIDYCQYKGKCSGGYSYATMKQDSRIMMNYTYNLDSVSTIAHESGHNVHHQFVNEYNPIQYRSVSSIVSEVMSLTNEILLSDYLANHGETKEEKLAGISNILGVITSNLFGAVREAKIEQDMYKEVSKGGVITKELMDKLTKKSLKKYYGDSVKLDKYSKNSWVTRSHYYMHFYLYSYAICVSVATDVASKIINGDAKTLEKYYDFMKVGYDKWPSEAFSVLGINLEEKIVYENAIKYFDSLIDKYYEIYNQEVGE